MTIKIDYTFDEVASAVGGKTFLRDNGAVEYLSLDTRRIAHAPKTLFWAVRTESGDGAAYIKEAYALGVRNFVTEVSSSSDSFGDANFIIVENALDALQKLAAHHRARFSKLHVIGITGSNGKTLVKEWLYELLSPTHRVVKSPRSFNSQIGVPLSVLQIREHHRIGIFEAGISKPGEMQKLERMIRPDTGIVTNIGSAHDEGFSNRSEKLYEKLRLFVNANSVVAPVNIKELITDRNLPADKKIFSWWGAKGADIEIEQIIKSSRQAEIRLKKGDQVFDFAIPFTDEASIEGAISSFCAIEAAGFYSPDLNDSFLKLHPVSMRLEIRAGHNRCVVINDSYSNDLQSLLVAIDFLKQQNLSKTTVILSDLLQSGLPPDQLYGQVAALVREKEIDRFVGIGGEMTKHARLFQGMDAHFFTDIADFIRKKDDFQFREEAILIKGARKFQFEKLSGMFESQLHQTVLAVNLSHLAHNIRTYKSRLKPETKLMAMVKAFAYGSGSDQIATFLQHVKADYLAVAFTDEGVRLREAGIHLPIMVLNVDRSSFDHLIEHRLEPEMFSFRILKDFAQRLRREGIRRFPIHLKIDTGMHRLGFEPSDMNLLIGELRQSDEIRVKSVFTHLVASDDPARDDFSRHQLSLFKSCVDKLKEARFTDFITHVSNTSAISRLSDSGFQMDMVRLGIGMYGIDENPAIKDYLKPVSVLSTTISQIKKVRAGDSVGYGRKHILTEDKTVATVGVGYADGYPRMLGNGIGSMVVNGKSAPTIGNVCMDMTMLDITAIPHVHEADEVIVFGEQPTIQQVAQWANTIPYEILTGISSRVKRVYFTES